MMSLIRSQSLANTFLRTATSACCPARLHAKAFVHAAATAATARKRKQNKQQKQQQTLSHSLSPRSTQRTVAAQAAQLSNWSVQQPPWTVQGGISFLSPAVAQALGLNEKLRSNPRRRGSTSQSTGLQLMHYSLNKYYSGLCGKGSADLEGEPNPSWLGQYPEMLAHAARHNGSLTPEQARFYLEHDPNCEYIVSILQRRAGITADDLHAQNGEQAKFHIDHIHPRCKGGLNHPMNYCIMPASDNMRFGGSLDEAKCEYVGPQAFKKSLAFHAVRLAEEGASTVEPQLQPVRGHGTAVKFTARLRS